MKSFACYIEKLQHLCSVSWQATRLFIFGCYRELLLRINPLSAHILYFVSLSFVGFGILKSLKPRTAYRPRNIDLFFTSVSATTVSSMSVVEMEVFSNAQLIVLTILMFIGGEIFTSMTGLHLTRSKIVGKWKREAKVDYVPDQSDTPGRDSFHHIELSIAAVPDSGIALRFESEKGEYLSSYNNINYPCMKYDSIKFLSFAVLGYLVVVQVLGISSVLLYLSLVSSANDVLRDKGIKTLTFAVFTVVSTFASCGFVPTNENMMVFRKNSGLLLILIPQILFGNTLFPSCLRFLIWVLGKRVKKEESKYLLKNTREVGYLHLLQGQHSFFLVPTVLGFILIGFILFCALEWNSAGLSGLNSYQKVAGVIFEITNARHTGETIVDLSAIAPAILVFFVVMMYLPPYTSFLPIKRDDKIPTEPKPEAIKRRRRRRKVGAAQNLIFSQLAYLAIFIILICITERKSLKDDPLNFSVLNITVEVISAYGNVGFTTGYSCERELRRNPDCVNKWYGFSGKWSDEGKIILITVMFFGRLKKFNMNGGRAWNLT